MPTEEEMKAMQEKLKDMSPEELKEFQKQNCVFCQIMSGKVNSKKIYEDDKCIAILDINPANPGHVLLIPKEHFAIMPLIPEDLIRHLFMISKQMSAVLLKALKVQGTNIFVANGAAAGQKAQHFMIHIIPRMEKDKLGLELKGQKANEKELEELRELLVKKINQDFGIKAEEEPEEVEELREPEGEPDEEKEELEVNPKKKIVEAEFEEETSKEKTTAKSPSESEEDLENEKNFKKKKETKKKTTKKKEEPKEEKEDVSLDDIANLITG